MKGHVIAQPQLFTRILKGSKGSGVGQHEHVLQQTRSWLTGVLFRCSPVSRTTKALNG